MVVFTLPVFSQTLEDAKRLHEEAVCVYGEKWDYIAALQKERAAIQLMDSLDSGETSLYGESLCLLAQCYYDVNSPNNAIDYAKKALAVFANVQDRLGCAKAKSLLCAYYSINEEADKAKEFLDADNEIAELVGVKDSLYAIALVNKSCYYEEIEEYKQALDLCLRAVEIINENDFTSVICSEAIGQASVLCRKCRDYVSAFRYALTCALERTKRLGEKHVWTTSSIRTLMEAYASVLDKNIEIEDGMKHTCDSLLTNIFDPIKIYDVLFYNSILQLERENAEEQLRIERTISKEIYDKDEALESQLNAKSELCGKLFLRPNEELDVLHTICRCYEEIGDTLSEDYLACFGSLSVYYSLEHQNAKALLLSKHHLDLTKLVYGQKSIKYSFALGVTGQMFYFNSDITSAIDLEEQAVGLYKELGISQDYQILVWLGQLFVCYSKLGETDKVDFYKDWFMHLINDNFNDVYGTYLRFVYHLALYHIERRQYLQAIQILDEARNAEENSLQERFKLTIDGILQELKRSNNEYSYFATEDSIKSLQFNIYKNGTLFSDYISNITDNLNMLSECHEHLQNHRLAYDYAQKAYEIDRCFFSDENFYTIHSLSRVANGHFYLGEFPNAQLCLTKCAYNLMDLVTKRFLALDFREQEQLWQENAIVLNERVPQFALTIKTDSLNMLLYDALLFSKGLLLNSEREMRRMFANDKTLSTIYEKWCINQRELKSQSNALPDERTVDIDSLSNVINEQMLYLLEHSTDFAGYVKKLSVKWEEVKTALGENEVAVEFFQYDNKYYAVILKCDSSSPKIIEICSDEQIQTENYDNASLYKYIWKPLAAELTGVKTIYFAPDRELHKIAIEYALIGGKQRMCDKYNMVRLSSTREVVERKGAANPKSAVLYGGLKYDLEKDELIAESRKAGAKQLMASRAVENETLRYGVSYLKGTEVEVENIERDLRKKGIECVTVSGNAGTEESFRALSGKSVDILHLATHGYFWSEEDAERRDYIPFLNGAGNTGMRAEDKAMLRSGLFFSGANVSLRGEELPDDVKDGVLTAMELSNLNLGKVDLVVLSACQSGLGETSGDGVFGLQRGFKLAGAKTLLMSLWKVDDKATQILMTEFYKNLLAGDTKVESLKKAQKVLQANEIYKDPEYWAGWILLDALN